MAKTKVSEWSTTAASNTDIDGITLDGAVMTPSLVDNAVRELMEQIAVQLGDMGVKGADIASATTTNLASATGWYLDITGTTTITGFGTVNEGQLYMLRFTGVLTLTYNATSLILPGAASITTAAGDVAFMMSLGSGNWRCLVYQRASGLAGDVTLTGTQTLTNKTLTAPTINSPAFGGSVPTGLDASTTAKGISEFATATEFRTGTDTARSLVVSEVWSSAAEVTLTDAATIAVDMSTFINAVVTLGGNRAMGNPTNEKVGQTGHIRIVQDGTGSRTLSYGTDWEFAAGSAPVLSTAAGAQDLLFYRVIASNRIFASLVKAIA